MNKSVGDQGEAFVAELLRRRGYRVREVGGNFPTVDLFVDHPVEFRVSVKTSASRPHVRLGRETSLARLRDDDFVFAIFPKSDVPFGLSEGGHRLLIIPGGVARDGGLEVHRAYLAGKSADGEKADGAAGVIVKGYSKKPLQQRVWANWLTYENGWHRLPGQPA